MDMCFQGCTWGMAHNNIQVTRKWLNFQGKSALQHMARQFVELEEARKQLE